MKHLNNKRIIFVAVLLFLVSKSATSAMSVNNNPTSTKSSPAPQSSLDDEGSVNLKRWAGRWSENNLGWHRDYLHPSLATHGDKILPIGSNTDEETCESGEAYRVFVPLCGKTMDMAHMAAMDGVSQVVGLDGIQKALEEFANENPQLEIVAPKVEDTQDDASSSSYKYFNGKKIQLIKGDFFALDSKDTSGRFEAIYDRASMVAIEPSLRQDYVAVMERLVQPGGKILLVAIERDDDKGPPFSVTESDVRSLYEGQDWVESVTALEGGRDEDDRFNEGLYLIQAKKKP